MRLPLFLLSLLAVVSSACAGNFPFDFVDGHIVVHASIHAQPVDLLLDSGASQSILSLEAARRLHIGLGPAEAVDGVNATATAYNIAPVKAQSGGVELGAIALAIDLRSAERLCSERIDGLIGADFFQNRITQIDYAARQVRILDAAPEAGQRVELLARNGVYCVQLGVNGSHPRWTRLDTGCNDALHWVIPRSVPQVARGVSVGFITNDSDETLVSVRIGGMTLPHVPTVLHGSEIFPGEAGLLGSGVLSQYRVTIDTIHGSLVLN